MSSKIRNNYTKNKNQDWTYFYYVSYKRNCVYSTYYKSGLHFRFSYKNWFSNTYIIIIFFFFKINLDTQKAIQVKGIMEALKTLIKSSFYVRNEPKKHSNSTQLTGE